MSERQYDLKTQHKLTKIYQDVITNYSSDNKYKINQLNDLKATLNINQNLLYNYINSSELKEEDKINLFNKYTILREKIESLLKLSQIIELKIHKLETMKEIIPVEIKEEINDLVIKNNIRKNEITEKDIIIKKIKQDLERTRNNALFKEPKLETFITEPTKKSLEKNEELLLGKSIMIKVTRRHSQKKKFANKLKKQLKSFKNELNEIKKDTPELFKNDDYLKLTGYNNNEENEEEYEDEDDKNGSSEESFELDKKSEKQKKKEFTELEEKYNKLIKDYESYEGKIKEYKKLYKKMKSQLTKIKENFKG